jgi:hypothetical protein
MKTLKTIITIAGLLAIGFTAGFFTHRYAVQQRIERVARMRFAAGFENHLFRVIRAEAQQREELRPIVDKYAQRVAEEFNNHNKKRRSIIDSMYQEIRPFLSEAQLERLENFHRRFRPYGPSGPDDRPPLRDRRKRERRKKTGR